MTVAIKKVHAPKGPWVTDGGYEYNAGPDGRGLRDHRRRARARSSLDRRRWGTGWAIAQLAAGVGGGLAMVKFAEAQARGRAAASGASPARPRRAPLSGSTAR